MFWVTREKGRTPVRTENSKSLCRPAELYINEWTASVGLEMGYRRYSSPFHRQLEEYLVEVKMILKGFVLASASSADALRNYRFGPRFHFPFSSII